VPLISKPIVTNENKVSQINQPVETGNLQAPVNKPIVSKKSIINQPEQKPFADKNKVIEKPKVEENVQLPVKAEKKVVQKSENVQQVVPHISIPAEKQQPEVSKITPQKTETSSQNANPKPTDSKNVKSDNSIVFTIQLEIVKKYREPAMYKDKYNFKEDVYFIERNGEFMYFAGMYDSIDGAKAAITRYGMMGYIVSVDKSLLRKGR
jgi:hypothetical protein